MDELEQWSHKGAEWFHQMPETQLYAAVAVAFITTFLLLSSNSAFLVFTLFYCFNSKCSLEFS